MNKQIDDLLDAYWDAAYEEGINGRTHDTHDGRAQAIRSALVGALKARGQWPEHISGDTHKTILAEKEQEPVRKHDQFDDMRDYFQQGKPDGMTDEGWRQLTKVIPFRLCQVMKGHLYSIEVVHESLNRVADECLDGFGWSTGEWVRKDGMPGGHIEKDTHTQQQQVDPHHGIEVKP